MLTLSSLSFGNFEWTLQPASSGTASRNAKRLIFGLLYYRYNTEGRNGGSTAEARRGSQHEFHWEILRSRSFGNRGGCRGLPRLPRMTRQIRMDRLKTAGN